MNTVRPDIVSKRRPGKMLMPMTSAPYLAALGRFVHAFSQIEAHLTVVLWVAAKIDFDIARALLSGVRIDGAINLLGRTMDARGIIGPNRTSLDAALQQLGLINKMRNDVLHYGATALANGELIVSNKMSAHLISRLREVPISVQSLDDMTYDLDKIWVQLEVSGHRLIFPDLQFSIRGYDERLQRAWRYKPAPQSAQPRKTPKTHQGQPPPPVS